MKTGLLPDWKEHVPFLGKRTVSPGRGCLFLFLSHRLHKGPVFSSDGDERALGTHFASNVMKLLKQQRLTG